MLTAFRPGAVVSARAASPFPAQIFIAPDGRHSSRRRADNPSAPSTRVFNARGTRSFLPPCRAWYWPRPRPSFGLVQRGTHANTGDLWHRHRLISAAVIPSSLSFSRPLVMNLVKEVRLPDSAPAARFLHFFLRPLAVLLIHVPQAVDRFNCV